MNLPKIIKPSKLRQDKGSVFFAQIILGIASVVVTFILYGAHGINLTDEGFWLAQAKRILSGEIPHRDFVHVRLTGSGLLHASYLSFLPDHWVLFSRFVALLQLYGACAVWIACLRRYLFKDAGNFTIWWASTASFLLSLHDFPIMAWNTIDGIMFCSLGIFCYFQEKVRRGLFLVGCSLLFKQSFFLVPLFLLVLFFANPHRTVPQKTWAAFCGMIPCLLYFLWVGLFGGAADLIGQVLFASGQLSTREIWVGFLYRPGQWFLVGMGAGILWRYLNQNGKLLFPIKIAGLVLWLFGLIWALDHPAEMHRAMISASLFSWGFTLVGALVLWKSNNNLSCLAGSALVLAYSSSISVGYNNFLLMLGPLVFSALAVFYATAVSGKMSQVDSSSRRIIKWLALVFFVAYLKVFHSWRTQCIYRDLPAAQLQESLSGVLPGARGVFTSAENCRMIRDLEALLSKYPNRPVAVLPAFAAVWPGSDRCNPLAADWLQEIELPNKKTWDKVFLSLERIRQARGVVLFSKYYVEDIGSAKKKLSLESEPTRGGYSVILKYFSALAPSYETEFFRIYIFE